MKRRPTYLRHTQLGIAAYWQPRHRGFHQDRSDLHAATGVVWGALMGAAGWIALILIVVGAYKGLVIDVVVAVANGVMR